MVLRDHWCEPQTHTTLNPKNLVAWSLFIYQTQSAGKSLEHISSCDQGQLLFSGNSDQTNSSLVETVSSVSKKFHKT